MESKSLFLKWALFACLVAIGAAIASTLGWAGYVMNGDETHLTLVNLTVLAFTTLWCGRLSWRLSNGEDPRVIKHALESGWFASSVCVTLGLLGTVVGYYMMLQSGPGGGEDAGEQLVRQIRASMGTALINTVVGGFCGLLIELQSHFIGQAAKKSLLDGGEETEDDS
jgi:hypothetical protein